MAPHSLDFKVKGSSKKRKSGKHKRKNSRMAKLNCELSVRDCLCPPSLLSNRNLTTSNAKIVICLLFALLNGAGFFIYRLDPCRQIFFMKGEDSVLQFTFSVIIYGISRKQKKISCQQWFYFSNPGNCYKLIHKGLLMAVTPLKKKRHRSWGASGRDYHNGRWESLATATGKILSHPNFRCGMGFGTMWEG